MRLVRLSLGLTTGLIFLFSGAAAASSLTGSPLKGLAISPATNYTSINAGSQKVGTFMVANDTSNILNVALSVKQFSVNNYSYTYNFSPPQKDWITLSADQVTLNPGQSEDISYTIKVPLGAPPGGNYYTFFASTTLSSGAIKNTVQAASLFYLTVNGNLIRSAWVSGNSMQTFVFGKQVNYHFNVTDTGNVYYFIYVSGKIHGLSAGPSQTPLAHIVMPGKIRTFKGSLKAPVLPGIYHTTYGFTTDSGASQEESHWIIYLPPWSIAALLFILLGLNLWYTKRTR